MFTLKSKVALLKKLLFLKEVIDNGQIQSAAEKNGLRHSNLSKSISELEEEMHTTLLHRSPKGIEPTGTAQQLYEDIENISEYLDKIRETFINKGEMAGYITIFVGIGFIGNYLLKELSFFYAQHPKIRLDILMKKNINISKTDVAIVTESYTPRPKGKILLKIKSDMHLFSSDTYIKKHGKPKDINDMLQNYDLCMPLPYLNNQACHFISKKAKHLNTTADSEMVIFNLIQSGDGIALLHDWTSIAACNLICLDYLNFKIEHNFLIICNPAVEKTLKINALIGFLKNMCEKNNIKYTEY